MVSDSSVPALEMMSQHDGLCPLLSELVIPDLSILVSELLEPTAYQIHHCHPHYLMSSAPEIVGGWMDWWMRVQHLWLHLLLIVKRKHSSVLCIGELMIVLEIITTAQPHFPDLAWNFNCHFSHISLQEIMYIKCLVYSINISMYDYLLRNVS